MLWLQSLDAFIEPLGILVNAQGILVTLKFQRILTITSFNFIANFRVPSLKIQEYWKNGTHTGEYGNEFICSLSISLNTSRIPYSKLTMFPNL